MHIIFKGLPPHSAGLRKALHRRGERVGKGAKRGREGGGESRREVRVVSGKHGTSCGRSRDPIGKWLYGYVWHMVLKVGNVIACERVGGDCEG